MTASRAVETAAVGVTVAEATAAKTKSVGAAAETDQLVGQGAARMEGLMVAQVEALMAVQSLKKRHRQHQHQPLQPGESGAVAQKEATAAPSTRRPRWIQKDRSTGTNGRNEWCPSTA